MIDMQGILSEYLPLQLIRFGDVYADEGGDPHAWLNEYDFIWKPISDSSSYIPVLLGDEVVRFGPDSDRNKVENLVRRINGQPLRMPKISICSSKYMLLVANELSDELEFTDKLGITRSASEVYDAAGHLHTNFTVLSFHKVFFHQRFETRFKDTPSDKRLLVCIELDAHSSTYLIHQSLLERWKKYGVEEVNYDIKAEHLSLNTLMTLDFYWPNRPRSFANMDDFQQNRNGDIGDY
ncbi:hypothetical protein GCM10007938_03790 [Vibrio zhanjiangensis]|uniref:Uncharacterized protein n=1 Tax=Vibrio zhanjiangensis TaxID=1046128 RepID=A0ABQ6ETX5_9VIBR|nr:hypothetical protein [Vibrio zhanjiangensis]GLT16603.1 hypothetical protein GCM10007938_03790 [Vibrio zhanjiangensis]